MRCYYGEPSLRTAGRGVGRAPPLSLPPARLGKVRRKWAEGARPAADSQPQGGGGAALDLGGDETPGSSVDKAPGSLPTYARSLLSFACREWRDHPAIGGHEGGENLPRTPSREPLPPRAGHRLSPDTLRSFRSGSRRPRPCDVTRVAPPLLYSATWPG